MYEPGRKHAYVPLLSLFASLHIYSHQFSERDYTSTTVGHAVLAKLRGIWNVDELIWWGVQKGVCVCVQHNKESQQLTHLSRGAMDKVKWNRRLTSCSSGCDGLYIFLLTLSLFPALSLSLSLSLSLVLFFLSICFLVNVYIYLSVHMVQI